MLMSDLKVHPAFSHPYTTEVSTIVIFLWVTNPFFTFSLSMWNPTHVPMCLVYSPFCHRMPHCSSM